MALILNQNHQQMAQIFQQVTAVLSEAKSACVVKPGIGITAGASLHASWQKLSQLQQAWTSARLLHPFAAQNGPPAVWEDFCVGPDRVDAINAVFEVQGQLASSYAACISAAVAYLWAAEDVKTQSDTHMAVLNQIWDLFKHPGAVLFAWPAHWPSPHLDSNPALFAAADRLLTWLLCFTRSNGSAWRKLKVDLTVNGRLGLVPALFHPALCCLGRNTVLTSLPPQFIAKLSCIFAEQFGAGLRRAGAAGKLNASVYEESGAAACHRLLSAIHSQLGRTEPPTFTYREWERCRNTAGQAAVEVAKLALSVSWKFTPHTEAMVEEVRRNVLMAFHVLSIADQLPGSRPPQTTEDVARCAQQQATETGPALDLVPAKDERARQSQIQLLDCMVACVIKTPGALHCDALAVMQVKLTDWRQLSRPWDHPELFALLLKMCGHHADGWRALHGKEAKKDQWLLTSEDRDENVQLVLSDAQGGSGMQLSCNSATPMMVQVRKIMLGVMLGIDQTESITKEPEYKRLIKWSETPASAANAELLLRDAHGPWEESDIGEDLEAVAVFFILAVPVSESSPKFVKALVSLAATVLKLVVRLTDPILVTPKVTGSAATAGEATATDAEEPSVAATAATASAVTELARSTAAALTAASASVLAANHADVQEEGRELFDIRKFSRSNRWTNVEIGSMTRRVLDNGEDEEDTFDQAYAKDAKKRRQESPESDDLFKLADVRSGGGAKLAAYTPCCKALLQLRALTMLSVLRLSEWHARCELDSRLLTQTTVLKDALQSILAQCHQLTCKEVSAAELALAPFNMHMRCLPEGMAVDAHLLSTSGAGAAGSEPGRNANGSDAAAGSQGSSDAEPEEGLQMEFVTAGWEGYSHAMWQGPLFPGCCNPSCNNMSGASEADLPTQQCACKRACYCSLECKQAGWTAGGHSSVCGKRK